MTPSPIKYSRRSSEGHPISPSRNEHLNHCGITSQSSTFSVNGDSEPTIPAQYAEDTQKTRSSSTASNYEQRTGISEPDSWIPDIDPRGSAPHRDDYFQGRQFSRSSISGRSHLQADGGSTDLLEYPIKSNTHAKLSLLPLTDDECKLVKHFFSILMPWVRPVIPYIMVPTSTSRYNF